MARRTDRISTALRLDPDLHARLYAAAEERGLAVNFLMERLLSEGLDDLVPADEFRLTKPPLKPWEPTNFRPATPPNEITVPTFPKPPFTINSSSDIGGGPDGR